MAYGRSRMMLPDPNTMLAGLRGEPQRDPRLDVIDQMARQGDVQRPGMKTEQDFRKQFDYNEPPTMQGAPGVQDQAIPPSPDQLQEADDASKMSDEDLLKQVQKGMNSWQMTGDQAKDTETLNRLKQGNDPQSLQEFQDLYDDFYGDEGVMNPKNNINDRDPSAGRFPPTVEEFKKQYGREPATDAEVEHYYGPADDEPDTEDDLRKGR